VLYRCLQEVGGSGQKVGLKMSTAKISWTKSRKVAMSENGWMIQRTDTDSGPRWLVIDSQELFVGQFETQADAEGAVL